MNYQNGFVISIIAIIISIIIIIDNAVWRSADSEG